LSNRIPKVACRLDLAIMRRTNQCIDNKAMQTRAHRRPPTWDWQWVCPFTWPAGEFLSACCL